MSDSASQQTKSVQRTFSNENGNQYRLALTTQNVDDDSAHLEAMLSAACEAAANTPEHISPIKDDETAKITAEDEKALELGAQISLVGQSLPVRELLRMLARLQRSHASVLITGENGTGKELVARGIHQLSPRIDKKFVATNCSAFNDNLLESEMFGHKRGAFTGAMSDKAGLFRVADKGTLFLDEVGDMSPALQVKLLRVLQEGTFTPVGATQMERVDVRIIAATNRDLKKMVADGSFREDLYYRLNVVALRVPPLRERRSDIPLLVTFFLDKLKDRYQATKTISEEALARLMLHDWPGNIRELQNEIERLWVLSGADEEIDASNINLRTMRNVKEPKATPIPKLADALIEVEKDLIRRSLKQADGQTSKAAEILGMSRRNFVRKMRTHEIESEKTTL